MEAHFLKRKENIEKARAKLSDTKNMLDETINRGNKLEMEFKEDKAQYQKKKKNLQNVQTSQATRLEKVTYEVNNMETVVALRMAEKEALMKSSEELKEELKQLKESNKAEISTLQATLEELDKQIMKLDLAKDVELLLQLGFTSLPSNIQETFAREIFRIKTEAMNKRQQSMAELERAIVDKEREIKEKKEELSLMKEKYASLAQIYDMAKKVVKQQRTVNEGAPDF